MKFAKHSKHKDGIQIEFDPYAEDDSKALKPLESYGTGPKHGTPVWLPEPPPIEGDLTAAGMVQLYWMALLRDVPFIEWNASQMVCVARKELNGMGLDLFYPEFQDHPFPHDSITLPVPQSERMWGGIRCYANDYGLDTSSVDEMAEGSLSGREWPMLVEEQCSTFRHTAMLVHSDHPIQFGIEFMLWLLQQGATFKDGAGLVDGISMAERLIGMAHNEALEHAFANKWHYRHMRPSALAANYESGTIKMPDVAANSIAVELTRKKQGNVYLSQCYPEGEPPHPAYPAGHSACTAAIRVAQHVLEADGDMIEKAVKEGSHTVSISRSWAGVHHYYDNIEGIRLGQYIADAVVAREKPKLLAG